MNVQAQPPKTDEPKTKLIEIAARLTDRAAAHQPYPEWLRTFRIIYRHMAASYGLSTRWMTISDADVMTDALLEPKADSKAA